MSAGKGSKPRPYCPTKYAKEHERIFKKRPTKNDPTKSPDDQEIKSKKFNAQQS